MKTLKDVVLIYPFTKPAYDRSKFRLPPLGLGYIASYLRGNNLDVNILDCTFKGEKTIIKEAQQLSPRIIGIYSMYSMQEATIRLAKALREKCDTLVVGGPLPSVMPEPFLQYFDIVVIGEGEQTMLEIAKLDQPDKLREIRGIVYKEKDENDTEKNVYTQPRSMFKNLDTIPYPARDLFDNSNYIRYYTDRGLEPTTSIMTSRGCPFSCDFCSKPVFGSSLRQRSPKNIIDEISEALHLGYTRIYFQDDCFTISKNRLEEFCQLVLEEDLVFSWECLSRVDGLDSKLAILMRKSGCVQIFFGLESGNNKILEIMKKEITLSKGREAIKTASDAGIMTGAFFIIGYPGETDDTILDTLNYASSLPLDYLSFSLPYPIPGTGLYEKTKNLKHKKIEPKSHLLIDHELVYESEFSERKLKFGITKGVIQFQLKKQLKGFSGFVETPFKKVTNRLFKMMK